MAASTAFSSSLTFNISSAQPKTSRLTHLSSAKLPSNAPIYPCKPLVSTPTPSQSNRTVAPLRSAAAAASTTTFHGVCYVVGDNIDTDQIIPAEYLTLVPSKPEEYQKLGSYALCGLPSTYQTRFVDPGEFTSKYSIVIGGDNFGCGSSREHAPVALGAAGVSAVVAESYARIFFRNSVSTGEIYPLESEVRVCEECKTGDVVTVELGQNKLINHTTGKEYKLKPIGDAGPVVEAGGIFAYARKTGMIPSREVVLSVYDNGSVFSPEVLDLTEDDLMEKFAMGVSMVTSLSLAISYPTLAAAPHMLINGYKNLLSIAVETEFSFPLADKVKEYLKDPSKFAVAAAPVAAAAAAGSTPAAASAVEEKKEEPAEESDDEIGFSLFDD